MVQSFPHNFRPESKRTLLVSFQKGLLLSKQIILLLDCDFVTVSNSYLDLAILSFLPSNVHNRQTRIIDILDLDEPLKKYSLSEMDDLSLKGFFILVFIASFYLNIGFFYLWTTNISLAFFIIFETQKIKNNLCIRPSKNDLFLQFWSYFHQINHYFLDIWFIYHWCLELFHSCEISEGLKLYQCLYASYFSKLLAITPSYLRTVLSKIGRFREVDFGDWQLFIGETDTIWNNFIIYANSLFTKGLSSQCRLFSK